MRRQVNAGLGDWVSRKLAENGRRPVSSPAPRSKPWWRRVIDNKGKDVVQTLATGIGGVEIARYARLLGEPAPSPRIGRSLAALWGSMRHQAEKWQWDWEKVQAKVEDLRGRTALYIQNIAEGTGNWWQKARMELDAHWTSFHRGVKMRWDALRRNGLNGLKVKPGDLLDFSGSVADGVSLAGYAAYVVTGDERARYVGDAAQVAAVPAAVRQVIGGIRALPKTSFQIGRFWKGATLLGKVAGPLAIVTGAIDAVRGIYSLGWGEAHDGKRDNKDVQAIADAVAGGTALLGGVMLLIPGLQPVAGLFLGVSAIASGVSVVAEHWSSIQSFFARPSTPYPGIQPTPPVSMPPSMPPAMVLTPASTPTPPSTSIPSGTPTPPATNTPSPTPQTTQTPAPTQTPQP